MREKNKTKAQPAGADTRKSGDEQAAAAIHNEILNAMVDPVVVFSLQGKCVFANKAYCQLFDLEPDKFIGKSFMDFPGIEYQKPEEIKKYMPLFQNIIEKGETTSIELETVMKDGTRIPVSVTGGTIKDGDGRPTHIVAVIHDVTKKKSVEDDLLESEERFRTLINNIPIGVFRTVPGDEGRFIMANPALAKMYGYESPMEMLIIPVTSVYADPNMRRIFSEKLLARGDIKDEELLLKRKDHTLFWGSVTATVSYDGSGSVKHFDGTVVNITESKMLKDELKIKDDALESSINAIAIFDIRGYLTYSNNSFLNMWGYDNADEILGVPGVDFWQDEKQILSVRKTVLKQGSWTGEVVAKRKDSSIFDAHLSTSMVKDELGNLICMLVSVLDITERKNTEAELKRYRDHLEKLVAERTAELTEYVEGLVEDIKARKRAEEKLQRSLEKLREITEGTAQAMAKTTEMKDPYTAGHQRRVAQLASAIAGKMGLSENRTEGVRMAGLLHDIGKIYVPAEILNKPGQLTEIEFSMIKTHPQAGHDILKEIDFPWPIAKIVFQHHERLNGSGYPKGLSVENISLDAKILSVADVVEAISSHRPYRPALGIEAAIREITKNRGILYDEEAVDACLALLGENGFTFEQ